MARRRVVASHLSVHRGRRLTLIVALAASVMAGGMAPATASTPKPLITDYSATPSSLPYTGGPVTVSAAVTGASQCTFSSTAPQVAGLPTTVACDSGSASTIVNVAANDAGGIKNYSVTLTAVGGGVQASAVTKITIAAAPPKPTISAYTSSPAPVPYVGGTATLTATVTNASQCTFQTLSPAVSGLPETVDCSSGTASVTVAVAANTTTLTRHYSVLLTAQGAVRSANHSASITLAPAPPPVISDYGSTPTPVSWTGGSATLSATVANATTCTFSAKGKGKKFISGLPVTMPCSAGSVTTPVTVAANKTRRTKNYTVLLTASGSGTKVTTTATVTQSPVTAAPSVTDFTSSPSPVSSPGGQATLTATVENATTCTFSTKSDSVTGLPLTVPCGSGTVSAIVTVPANSKGRTQSYLVQLLVHGQRKKVKATTLITVAGPARSG